MNGAHVGKKCLTYGLVEFDICLSKERHYISTVIILYKQNVLCARMVGGPVEEKRAVALALRLPLAPERDATVYNSFMYTSNMLFANKKNVFVKTWSISRPTPFIKSCPHLTLPLS